VQATSHKTISDPACFHLKEFSSAKIDRHKKQIHLSTANFAQKMSGKTLNLWTNDVICRNREQMANSAHAHLIYLERASKQDYNLARGFNKKGLDKKWHPMENEPRASSCLP
jgi:hypothetical protein